jgi:hypothetical protein
MTVPTFLVAIYTRFIISRRGLGPRTEAVLGISLYLAMYLERFENRQGPASRDKDMAGAGECCHLSIYLSIYPPTYLPT